MSHEKDMDIVQQQVDKLIEHFDSVQIFVTKHDNAESDGTVSICIGAGNWFSRYGVVKEWLIKSDERSKASATKD